MIRADLDAAGIPYVTDGPDGKVYADFHSLRHSYLTLGGRSGIDLRTLQELAGHSKPELTARYSHRRLYDLAGAVDKLPNLVPPAAGPDPVTAEIPLPMTGTGGPKSAVPGAVRGGTRGHHTAPSGTLRVVGGEGVREAETLEMTGAGTFRHRPASIGSSEDDGTRTRNHRSDSPVL